MIERLLEVKVTQDGTIVEEVELFCCMTGHSRRLLVEHLGEGFYRSAFLGPD